MAPRPAMFCQVPLSKPDIPLTHPLYHVASRAASRTIWLAALSLGQRALDLASRVALGHGIALVVRLLAAGHADLRLGPVVLEVDAQGHQRIAGALSDPGQMCDLLAMQQQLAPPRGIVVEVAALAIGGDVRVPQPGFATFDTRVGLAQVGMSCAQRLDL